MNEDERQEMIRRWGEGWHDVHLPEPEPYCGVYWIIPTLLTAIALGLGFGALAWMVLRVWE